MANNKSALKRIKINERNRLRNKSYKTSMKRALKSYMSAIEAYRSESTPENKEILEKTRSLTYKTLDKCVKVNILHRNTVSRKKAQLARYQTLLST